MRKNLGIAIAISLFFLSSASWAQLGLNADPHWRALMNGPLATAAPVAARPAKSPGGLKSACTATATCNGGVTVSCSGSGTCTAVDQNCPNQQGYVNCGSSWVSCPASCPLEPNCHQYDHGGCTYTWDSSRQCCVGLAQGYFCPDSCLD